MTQIGVQAMMLKNDFANNGVFATLQAVREIGYRAVEISQVPMTAENVAELGRARDELGMKIGALSASLTSAPGSPNESLSDDFDKIVADARALDCSMLRIGMLPMDAMRSLDAVLEFCDRSDEMALRLAERGIRLYYHNHHIEFTKYEGKFLLDIIAEHAPHMGFEIDVHWVHRGGLDPVKTLRKYADRVAMVHLKDYRIGKLSQDAFDKLDAGDFAGFMAAFTGVVQFAEVGEGNLDFAEIVPVSQEIGAEYLLVEQDDQYGRTPLECLRTSHDNLVALGFGELF
ncbi:sugar phosphate isomerase/epimerase family protein [Humibacter albus]|uniref:sugar phosphate isomerase/epimerase family protein n=1 Tax=Humibacter albus TaxID=427754 RepID=UPI0003B43144|nr:sugar phosphate isomerase/epimerase [Humibacter albus]